jgi:ABC-2 type transport system permease protein
MKLYDKKYFTFLGEMALTQYKLKDQSTFLGLIWSFLDPLIMLVLLFVVFYLNMGKNIQFYPIYLLLGVTQYSHFANSTASSMRVLYSRKSLTCNTIFRKEILILSGILANSFHFVVSMFICVVISQFFGVKITPALLMLPVVLVLQLMLVSWISLILSCLYVFVRDIDNMYQVFLRMLFFITPIFYDVSFLENQLARSVVWFNPLTYLIGFSRRMILDGECQAGPVMLIFFLINAGMIHLALRIFRKYEPTFAEHL